MMQKQTMWQVILLLVAVLGEDPDAQLSSAMPTKLVTLSTTKPIPQYTLLSFLGGSFIMLLFVLVPVGLMAYRNRNSIVEFIKNR